MPVWKLWNEFGIEDAKMIGWWDELSAVAASDEEVKATAFVRKGRALVAVGNFSAEEKTVTLTFNWKRLGLRPGKIRARMPAVENFQPEKAYDPSAPLTIPAKKGFLIWLE